MDSDVEREVRTWWQRYECTTLVRVLVNDKMSNDTATSATSGTTATLAAASALDTTWKWNGQDTDLVLV